MIVVAGAFMSHSVKRETLPSQGFIDPATFKRRERIQVIAIARGLDGSIAPSAVVPVTVP